MRYPILLIALLLMALVACNHEPSLTKISQFDHQTWNRFHIKNFVLPIPDKGKKYDIALQMQFAPGFAYDEMPVYVTLKTPSGEERMREITIQVRKGGRFAGTPMGQNSLVEKVIWRSIAISDTGSCRLSVENMVPYYDTQGIVDLRAVRRPATETREEE